MDSERHDPRDEYVGGADEFGAGADPGGEANPSGYPHRGHRLDQAESLDGGGVRGQRRDGLRRVRHMSNWTAAALLAGTGAATVALATHATQAGTTATSAASGYSTQGTGAHAAPPHVKGSVVTSGGSGATVTTSTKVVNGHVVTTKVRHPAVWHDN